MARPIGIAAKLNKTTQKREKIIRPVLDGFIVRGAGSTRIEGGLFPCGRLERRAAVVLRIMRRSGSWRGLAS
jgi:hypothetical protein